MIVLADLEWIEMDGRFLTQLAAIRTNEKWETVSYFNAYVCPPKKCLAFSGHLAFGGVPVSVYEQALPVEDAVLSFIEWLEESDIIWTWADSNARFLEQLRKKYAAETPLSIRSAATKARALAGERSGTNRDPYAILGKTQPLPEPKHRAENDVEAMRLLFARLGMTEACLPERPAPVPQTPKNTQKAKNLRTIEKSEYNYIYLQGADVFHRCDCKLCLNSSRPIMGSVYYRSSAEGRRPCEVCKPIPNLVLVPITDAELARREAVTAGEFSRRNNEIIYAKMLSGETISIKRGNILGWCHFKGHPGAVSKALMKEHDCLGKGCRYFERDEKCPYWKHLELQKQTEEKRKAQIQKEKQQKAMDSEHLRVLTESWQEYLDDMDSDMYIVRVAKETPSLYKIFYVSDNRFADGNRYPNFLDTLKFVHPHYRIQLRHIRDVDGHFVTTSEYLNRRRK